MTTSDRNKIKNNNVLPRRQQWGIIIFPELAVVKFGHACSNGDIPAGAKRRASKILGCFDGFASFVGE